MFRIGNMFSDYERALMASSAGYMVARISWSKTVVIHEMFQQQDIEGVSFESLPASGWNGNFVFKQIESEIPYEIIRITPSAPKQVMQSVPERIKKEFLRRGATIRYGNEWGIVSPNNIITHYHPTDEDKASSDWIVLYN